MMPSIPSNITSITSINNAVEIIQKAQTDANPNVAELNNAIRTLVAQDFQNVSGDVVNLMRQVDFSKIQDQVIRSRANETDKKIYMALSTPLIKRMEKLQPGPALVHQAYHGNAITTGIDALKAHLSEQAVPELRTFIRQYTDDLLSNYSTKTPKKVYLIRDSSMVGAQNYVISSKIGGQPVDHSLLIRVKKEDGQEKWVMDLRDANGVVIKREFDSIDAILPIIGLGDALPVPVPTARQMAGYAVGYALAAGETRIPMSEDLILQALNCPISLQRLEDPVITPSGNTYSREAITFWIDQRHSDPISRQELHPHMLRQNLLAAQLARTRIDQWEQVKHTTTSSLADWKQDPILRLFKDPISHHMIKDPVVATDGITYERKTLTRYLKEHQNKLPNGTSCTAAELIPNYTAKAILEERKKKFQTRTMEA